MTGLALSSVSSLRRDIGDQCTLLRVHNGRVFAGSQEGTLACWMTDSGDAVWQVEMSGPISDIDFEGDSVYVVESSMIHCLEYDSGEKSWSSELEGSSDYVVATGDGIWATSSVYEIEIGDYTESTIWRFDKAGELQQRWTIGERCWFFGSDDDGLILGLGRPRCGALRIANSQLEHIDVRGGPVTCGAIAGNRILLGHSDGKVSEIGGSAELTGKTQVSAVLGIRDEEVAGLESGEIISSVGWSQSSSDPIVSLSLGFHPSVDYALWACSGGNIAILDVDTGDRLLELRHECKIWKSDSNESLVVLGDSDGAIHFVERDVLSRRLEGDSMKIEDDARKRELMDRIRGLRKG